MCWRDLGKKNRQGQILKYSFEALSQVKGVNLIKLVSFDKE